MVTINGKQLHDVEGTSVTGYLSTTDCNTERIVVELNGEILPKAQYAQTVLKDGDVMEVISFVGGG